ncbi:MAG: hypothetical protein J6S95_04835 [Lachnospiraceae bacterium]|nr:hypothetical protein [Lachnospiraceae bacterium]MBO7600458.1 hypothetical protein [Lachnospiraceae bacterium]
MSLTVKIVILILYAVCILFCTPMYTKKKYDHSTRTNKLIWKGITISIPTLTLIVTSLVHAIKGTATPFLIIMTFGMILCACGDIVLEIKFLRGGVLFLLGHLVYVLGILNYLKAITSVTIIVYLLLAVLGTIMTIDSLGKKYRYPLIAYNIVISGTFAMGVTLITTNSINNILPGIGVCFLVISDWLLARNKIAGSNFRRSLISLLFYFGGQVLVSSLVFFI